MKRFSPIVLTVLSLGLPVSPLHAQDPAACARIESDLERLICYDRVFRSGNQARSTGKVNRNSQPPQATNTTQVPSTTQVRGVTQVPSTTPAPGTTSNTSGKSALPSATGGKSDRGGGRFVPVVSSKSSKGDASVSGLAGASWRGAELEGGGYLLRAQSRKQHRNIIGQESWMEIVIACRANTTSFSIRFGGNIVASVLDSFQLKMRIDGRPESNLNLAVSEDFKAVGLWNGAESIPVIKGLFSGTEVQITGAPFFSREVTATFPIGGLQRDIEPLRKICSW